MGAIRALKRLKRDLDFWWFYKNFYKKFRFYTTSNSTELDEVYRIRYQVYCEEYKYIDKSDTKSGLEYDEWDTRSVHFIIRNGEGRIAATVRLILGSEIGFPIEKHFDLKFKKNVEDSKIAEISRFIVANKYRRHHLMFVLIKGIYLYVKSKDIQYLYSVMDDRLITLLHRIGIPFKQIGDAGLFQGFTAPYILDCNQFDQDLKQNNKRLLHYLNQGGIDYNSKDDSYSLH